MKLSIARDSWILKVATFGGLEFEDRTDLCSVFWNFMWGVIRGPLFVTLGGTVGAGVLFMLVVQPVIALIALVLEGCAISTGAWIAMAGWIAIPWFLYEMMASDEGKASPVRSTVSSTVQLVKAGYRGWKDRTCVLVDVR